MTTPSQDPGTPAGVVVRLAARLGPTAILATVAGILVVMFGLLLFLVSVGWGPLHNLDTGTCIALHSYAVQHPAWVWAMKALSVAGSSEVVVPLLAITSVALIAVNRMRLAAFVATTLAGSYLLNSAAKVAISRTRPVLPDPVSEAGGWSFPSGHAQAAVVTSLLLLAAVLPFLPRQWRGAAVAGAAIMTAGIGFSRIALGVHYVSDVVAGFALGGAWVAVTAGCFGIWPVASQPPTPGRGDDAPRPTSTEGR